jgi:hypothetical protein
VVTEPLDIEGIEKRLNYATPEELAAQIHEIYLRAAHESGWKVKPGLDVPYSMLSEDAKNLDRVLANVFFGVYDDARSLLSEVARLREEVKKLQRISNRYFEGQVMQSERAGKAEAELTALRAVAEAVAQIEGAHKGRGRLAECGDKVAKAYAALAAWRSVKETT